MIYQNSFDDCGRAVTRNYLSYVRKNSYYENVFIKDKLQDFLSIKEELYQYNVLVEGRLEGDLKRIDKKNYPFILQVLYEDKRTHFLLVVKRIGNKFKVIDSEFGTYYLNIDEIRMISTGRVLITKKIQKDMCVKNKICFFSKMEIFLYALLFVLQASTLSTLFYYISSDILFEIKIGMIVFSFLLLFFQVLLNKLSRKRMDKDILIPYLKDSKSFVDYASLSELLSMNINRMSSIVSYGITCVLTLMIFISNGEFVFLLGLTSIAFTFLFYAFKNQYCKMNRDCSLKEERMKNNLNDKDFENDFYEARSIASTFEEGTIACTILEALVLSLFTVLEMGFGERFSLNFYLFYLFLGLSFTVMFYKLLINIFDMSKIRTKINSLTLPLDIYVKSFFHLVYNNSVRKGGFSNGRKSAHPRLPR